MNKHLFLLKPSIWLGEGKIQLNTIAEELKFHTRWNVGMRDESGAIECIQEIQVKGISDVMVNQFRLFDLTPSAFAVELDSPSLGGKVLGTGIITDQVIGWEFRRTDGFEGFEFYERQPDNTYLVNAEFATSDHFRTIIQGKIWQKAEST